MGLDLRSWEVSRQSVRGCFAWNFAEHKLSFCVACAKPHWERLN